MDEGLSQGSLDPIMQVRSQLCLLGMGLTVSTTFFPHRQGPDLPNLIKQVAGCFGRASLDSQFAADAPCGKGPSGAREGEMPLLGPANPEKSGLSPPSPRS